MAYKNVLGNPTSGCSNKNNDDVSGSFYVCSSIPHPRRPVLLWTCGKYLFAFNLLTNTWEARRRELHFDDITSIDYTILNDNSILWMTTGDDKRICIATDDFEIQRTLCLRKRAARAIFCETKNHRRHGAHEEDVMGCIGESTASNKTTVDAYTDKTHNDTSTSSQIGTCGVDVLMEDSTMENSLAVDGKNSSDVCSRENDHTNIQTTISSTELDLKQDVRSDSDAAAVDSNLPSNGITPKDYEVTPSIPNSKLIYPPVILADKFGDLFYIEGNSSLCQATNKTHSDNPNYITDASLPKVAEIMNRTTDVLAAEDVRDPKQISVNLSLEENKNILISDDSLIDGMRAEGINDVNLGDTYPAFMSHLSQVTDVALSSDQRKLISCDKDGKIRVGLTDPDFNVTSAFCLGHTDYVTSVLQPPIHPRILVSLSGDMSVRIWDIQDGEMLAMITLDYKPVRALFVDDKCPSLSGYLIVQCQELKGYLILSISVYRNGSHCCIKSTDSNRLHITQSDHYSANPTSYSVISGYYDTAMSSDHIGGRFVNSPSPRLQIPPPPHPCFTVHAMRQSAFSIPPPPSVMISNMSRSPPPPPYSHFTYNPPPPPSFSSHGSLCNNAPPPPPDTMNRLNGGGMNIASTTDFHPHTHFIPSNYNPPPPPDTRQQHFGVPYVSPSSIYSNMLQYMHSPSHNSIPAPPNTNYEIAATGTSTAALSTLSARISEVKTVTLSDLPAGLMISTYLTDEFMCYKAFEGLQLVPAADETPLVDSARLCNASEATSDTSTVDEHECRNDSSATVKDIMQYEHISSSSSICCVWWIDSEGRLRLPVRALEGTAVFEPISNRNTIPPIIGSWLGEDTGDPIIPEKRSLQKWMKTNAFCEEEWLAKRLRHITTDSSSDANIVT